MSDSEADRSEQYAPEAPNLAEPALPVEDADGLGDAAAREEREAAREAAAIGGDAGVEDEQDPADRAVIEGGGGEAEGFELAEDELREHAEHGDDYRYPTTDAFTVEEESDRSAAAYGEPDHQDAPEPDVAADDVEDVGREPPHPGG